MKFETTRYSITKYENADDEWGTETMYEVNCHDGWCLDDGSHLAYASSYDELRSVVNCIESEV